MTKELFDYPPILQVNHIVEYTGVSKSVVYEWFRLNDFPSLNVPGPKSIRRDDFEKWLLSKRKRGGLEYGTSKHHAS